MLRVLPRVRDAVEPGRVRVRVRVRVRIRVSLVGNAGRAGR